MTTYIKLYGGKADRFQEIKDQLSEDLGYTPSNPEVVGFLMATYHTTESSAPKQ